MTPREQFELYCKKNCDPGLGGFDNVKLCLRCKIEYLKTRLAQSEEKMDKVREWHKIVKTYWKGFVADAFMEDLKNLKQIIGGKDE